MTMELEGFSPILTPPSESQVEWVVPEPNMWDAFIVGFKPVPNPFYKEGEAQSKKFQFQWTFQLDESALPELEQVEGEKEKRYSLRGTYFTGTALGKHPKNKLVGLLKVADPSFDLDIGYVDEAGNSSLEAMGSAVEGRWVRLVTDIYEKDEDKKYLSIVSILRSPRGKVDMATLLAAQTGGKTDDIPF